MKKTTKKESTKKEPYKATVKVMGKSYETTGEDILEALSNFKIPNGKGRAILTIQKGDIKKERILQPAVTFRLFNTMGLSRQIALKQLSILFQGI